MSSKLRNHSWIITAPLAASAVAYLFFLFLPRMRDIKAVMAEMRGKQEIIDRTASLRPAIELAEREMQEASLYLDKWHARCALPSELPTIFSKISYLAKANGTITKRFEPQQPVDYQTLDKMRVTLVVSGGFAAIEQLIKNLEELPVTVWIEALKMESAREAGQTTTCEVSLAIFTRNNEKSD